MFTILLYICRISKNTLKMKLKKIFTLLISLSFILDVSAQGEPEKILVSDNIEIHKLSDNAYRHISYFQTESWGKVGANGLIMVKDGKALMIDTPWDNSQTKELTEWVKDSLHATVTTVIPTHWHGDCMGGLAYLQSQNVSSYANQMTIDIAEKENLPLPQHGFKESLTVDFQGLPIECYYPGGGHTVDNIVVWIPSENILFGGCLIKDMKTTNLGNLSDADVEAWPASVQKVIDKFPEAKTVIPGHGVAGSSELMHHTLHLLGY